MAALSSEDRLDGLDIHNLWTLLAHGESLWGDHGDVSTSSESDDEVLPDRRSSIPSSAWLAFGDKSPNESPQSALPPAPQEQRDLSVQPAQRQQPAPAETALRSSAPPRDQEREDEEQAQQQQQHQQHQEEAAAAAVEEEEELGDDFENLLVSSRPVHSYTYVGSPVTRPSRSLGQEHSPPALAAADGPKSAGPRPASARLRSPAPISAAGRAASARSLLGASAGRVDLGLDFDDDDDDDDDDKDAASGELTAEELAALDLREAERMRRLLNAKNKQMSSLQALRAPATQSEVQRDMDVEAREAERIRRHQAKGTSPRGFVPQDSDEKESDAVTRQEQGGRAGRNRAGGLPFRTAASTQGGVTGGPFVPKRKKGLPFTVGGAAIASTGRTADEDEALRDRKATLALEASLRKFDAKAAARDTQAATNEPTYVPESEPAEDDDDAAEAQARAAAEKQAQDERDRLHREKEQQLALERRRVELQMERERYRTMRELEARQRQEQEATARARRRQERLERKARRGEEELERARLADAPTAMQARKALLAAQAERRQARIRGEGVLAPPGYYSTMNGAELSVAQYQYATLNGAQHQALMQAGGHGGKYQPSGAGTYNFSAVLAANANGRGSLTSVKGVSSDKQGAESHRPIPMSESLRESAYGSTVSRSSLTRAAAPASGTHHSNLSGASVITQQKARREARVRAQAEREARRARTYDADTVMSNGA